MGELLDLEFSQFYQGKRSEATTAGHIKLLTSAFDPSRKLLALTDAKTAAAFEIIRDGRTDPTAQPSKQHQTIHRSRSRRSSAGSPQPAPCQAHP